MAVIKEYLDPLTVNLKRAVDLKDHLINVPSKGHLCGYYALARRIINDSHFAVIVKQFNQFYQTNWDEAHLAEVLKDMPPQQADTLLGLLIYNQCRGGKVA